MKDQFSDIRYHLEIGEITVADALAQVGVLMSTHKAAAFQRRAAEFINELIGMPSEPKAMTAEERKAAHVWEKAHRSGSEE